MDTLFVAGIHPAPPPIVFPFGNESFVVNVCRYCTGGVVPDHGFGLQPETVPPER